MEKDKDGDVTRSIESTFFRLGSDFVRRRNESRMRNFRNWLGPITLKYDKFSLYYYPG